MYRKNIPMCSYQKLKIEMDLLSRLQYEMCGDNCSSRIYNNSSMISSKNKINLLSLCWQDVRYISDDYKRLIITCHIPNPNLKLNENKNENNSMHEYEIVLDSKSTSSSNNNCIECSVFIGGQLYLCTLQCDSLPPVLLQEELCRVAAQYQYQCGTENGIVIAIDIESDSDERLRYNPSRRTGGGCGGGSKHCKRQKLNSGDRHRNNSAEPRLHLNSLHELHTCLVTVLSRYIDYYKVLSDIDENSVVLGPQPLWSSTSTSTELSISTRNVTDTDTERNCDDVDTDVGLGLLCRNYSNPWRKLVLVRNSNSISTGNSTAFSSSGVDVSFTVNVTSPFALPTDMVFYGGDPALVDKYEQVWLEHKRKNESSENSGIGSSSSCGSSCGCNSNGGTNTPTPHHPLQISLKTQLENILGLAFPTPEQSQSQAESQQEQDKEHQVTCGICYSHTLPSSRDPQLAILPTEICMNSKCNTRYHKTCLINWLSSQPTSRRSFGLLFGQCIFCQESINVRTVGI